ncbi:MAG: hypothetical protein KA163_06435 [Bacteroidia bacterium]|nr:hypothetical protein [Bacteroidia bacterium]
MKKIFFTLIIAALSLPSIADERPLKKEKKSFLQQNEGGEKCFDENTHIINLGVGFGSRSYHSISRGAGFSSGTTPAFSLTYEQALKKKLGPGYLGVGAYLGFQHQYYKYDYSYYDNGLNYYTYYSHHKWNYYMVAARAAYHWDVLNSKNAEVYAGVVIGMRFQIHNYETNDPGKKDPYTYTQSFAYPAYSVFAGARWYFAKNFGLFAEAGYGISYINAGFSIKF